MQNIDMESEEAVPKYAEAQIVRVGMIGNADAGLRELGSSKNALAIDNATYNATCPSRNHAG